MPNTGTLTRARIVQAIADTNGNTQQKVYETLFTVKESELFDNLMACLEKPG